jgi:hypothetical protein
MNSLTFDNSTAIPVLAEIADRISCSVITSTIEAAKTAYQIALEHSLPLSSTYKKIKKLQGMSIIHVEKIDLDGNGKRVAYYRSRIKSAEFNLRGDKIVLQLEKNDLNPRQTIALGLNVFS